MLAPAGAGIDQIGYLKSKFTFSATDWEMSIDLESSKHPRHEGASSYGSFNIYFLAHPPNADMQKNYN